MFADLINEAPLPPSLRKIFKDNGFGDSFSNLLKKVQSADSGSGIDYYQYSFDNTTWKDLKKDEYTFKGPIDTPLYIRAIDKVGNISDTYETYIKIVK